eukprot:5205152-Amphidinium_carterae.1
MIESHLRVPVLKVNEARPPTQGLEVGVKKDASAQHRQLTGRGPTNMGTCIHILLVLTPVAREKLRSAQLTSACTSSSNLAQLRCNAAFRPADKADLQLALSFLETDPREAFLKYGDVLTWDTSMVTDMSELFAFAD